MGIWIYLNLNLLRWVDWWWMETSLSFKRVLFFLPKPCRTFSHCSVTLISPVLTHFSFCCKGKWSLILTEGKRIWILQYNSANIKEINCRLFGMKNALNVTWRQYCCYTAAGHRIWSVTLVHLKLWKISSHFNVMDAVSRDLNMTVPPRGPFRWRKRNAAH